MKFSVPIRDLQYVVRMAKDLKFPSGPLGDTTSALLDISDGRLVMTGYNGEVLVKASTASMAEGPGTLVLDSSLLYNSISSFQGESKEGVGTSNIQFSTDEKGRKLNLSAKTKLANGSKVPHKRVFPLFSSEGFPDFSSVDSIKPLFKTKAAHLTRGIDGAAYSLSADRSNIIFTGFLFVISNSSLKIVATNGVSLTEYTTSIEYNGDEVSVVVPGATAIRAAKSFQEDEEVEVCITDRHFIVRSRNLLVGGPLIREDFPDYRSVIAPPTTIIELDKSTLIDNITNLAYEAASVPDSRISLIVSNEGFVSLKVGDSENSGILYSGKSENIQIDCNLRFLISSIRGVYGDSVKIGYSTPEMPMHFFSTGSEEGAEISSVLVPLRLELG